MDQINQLRDLLFGEARRLGSSLQREVLNESGELIELVGVRLDELVVDPVLLDQHIGDGVHQDQVCPGL